MSYSDRDRVYAWLDAGHGEKLTTLDRAVLVTIAERANAKTGVSAPGYEEPAQRWGVAPKSAGRSISRLHRFGLVDTVTRGQGQSRARYILTGEVAPPTGGPTSTPETSSSTPETSSSTPHVGSVLSKSSRSSNGVMTDDPSARASPALVSDEVVWDVAVELGDQTFTAAREWIDDRLARANGHVNNPDAYIRQALKNRKRDDKRQKDASGGVPAKVGRCAIHYQEQPCIGCAADRKARPEPDEHNPAAIRTLENIAAILDVEPVPIEDGDDDQQVEITRAGLDFGAYTNLPAQHITIYSEYSFANMDEPSPWPEGEPLPDERFRHLAIHDTGSARHYRPHDAVELAEHWHQQTRDQETTA